jgi:hypothetical protein
MVATIELLTIVVPVFAIGFMTAYTETHHNSKS